MAKQFLSSLNLNNLSADPGTAAAGDVYYNTASSLIKFYNGTSWVNVSSGAVGAGLTANTFTGTQTITPSSSVTGLVINGAASSIGAIVKANATTPGDLQQWQNSGGTSLAKVDASGNITAASFVRTSGTSSQFLKADGSVDSSTYLTTSTASSTYQPLDADLTSIAGLTATGLLKNTAGTWSIDTSTYLTTGTAASTYQPLDADLTSIAALTATGLLKNTAGTWSIDTNTYLTSASGVTTVNGSSGAITNVAITNAANTFTTTQTVTPATGVTAVSINGATSSTGLSITAAATPGTFIDYRDNNNVSVGSVGSDGTHFIKQIRNVGGSVNRAVFSDLTSSIIVNAANTNYIGLSVRRFNDSQTSDLQQWTNSSASTVYAKIDKDGNATAASFVRTGGTSAQFLKADGTVDSSTYLTTGTASSTYLPLTGGTVTGNVTATSFIRTGGTSAQYLMADGSTTTGSALPDIIPLDDLSGSFNGIDSRFVPKYQGIQQSITNSLRLMLSINGIIQYVDFPDYVWQSPLPRDGFQIDNDGYIAFSEVVPAGSSFDARIMPGPSTAVNTRRYPFKPVDILLGG